MRCPDRLGDTPRIAPSREDESQIARALRHGHSSWSGFAVMRTSSTPGTRGPHLRPSTPRNMPRCAIGIIITAASADSRRPRDGRLTERRAEAAALRATLVRLPETQRASRTDPRSAARPLPARRRAPRSRGTPRGSGRDATRSPPPPGDAVHDRALLRRPPATASRRSSLRKTGPSSGSGLSKIASTRRAPAAIRPSSAYSWPGMNSSTRIASCHLDPRARTSGGCKIVRSRPNAAANSRRVVARITPGCRTGPAA